MNTKKRIIAALLAALLVLGMLPAVFAAEYKLDLKAKPAAAEEEVYMSAPLNGEAEIPTEPCEEELVIIGDDTEAAPDSEPAPEGEDEGETGEPAEEPAAEPEEDESGYANLPGTVCYGDTVHIAAGELPVYILPASLGEDYIRNIPANVPEYKVVIDFDFPGDTYTVELTEGKHPWACETGEFCPHKEDGETECPFAGDYVGIIFYLNPRPHTHSYSGEWVVSEEGHCRVCLNSDGNCTEPVSEIEEHAIEAGICTVCGYAAEEGTAAPEGESADGETPADGEEPEDGEEPVTEVEPEEGEDPATEGESEDGENPAAEGESEDGEVTAPADELASGETPDTVDGEGEAPAPVDIESETTATVDSEDETPAAADGEDEAPAAADGEDEATTPEHEFTVIWSKDSGNHWRQCTIAGCSLDYTNLSEEEAALASFGAHQYGTTGDARFNCSVCGYENATLKDEYMHNDLILAVKNAAAAARNEIDAIKNLPEDQKQAAFISIADIENTAVAGIDAAADYEAAEAIKDSALSDISDIVKTVKLQAAKEAAKQSLIKTAAGDKSSLVQIALEDAIAAIDACESIAAVDSAKEKAEAELKDYVAFNAKKKEYSESIAKAVNENDTVEAHKIASQAAADVVAVIYNKEATFEDNLEILTELWADGKVAVLKQKAADDTQEALTNVTIGISTDVGAQLSGTTKSKLTNMLICSPAMSADVIRAIAVGNAVRLVVQVKNNPSPNPTERDLIVKAATGFEIVGWLDVSLYATVDGTNYDIPETRDKITIVLRVPANIVNNNPAITRTYIIGRSHNNIADLISPSFSKSSLSLTFETDKFSTYAYGYKDNGGTSGGGDVPKTGDASMPGLWITLMVISLAGIGATAVMVVKKNKT